MQSIQAIICYNGGSAGDLIKKLALLCHNVDTGTVHDNGMVTLSQYFKQFFIEAYYKNTKLNNINWTQISKIENSHFYSDQFVEIAQRLYFIDYPEDINSVILSEYVRKRHCGSWTKFLEMNIGTLPEVVRDKVNLSNCQQVFEIQWLKNIKSWRQNTMLKPIQFYDLLKKETILSVIEEVSGSNVKNMDRFDDVYTKWLETNSVFVELIN